MARKKRDERKLWIEDLSHSKDVGGLAEILADADAKGSHCRQALESLIAFDSPEGWDAIGSVLVESESAVVQHVIDALDQMETSGATRALAAALSNPDAFLRMAALRSLSRDPSSNVLVHLLRAARDPQRSVSRSAALVILRRVADRPAVLGEILEPTAEGILDLVDDRWAMELLSDSFPENIRQMAASRLGNIGGDDASQALVSMIQSKTVNGALEESCWRALEVCSSVSDFVLLPLLVSGDPAIKARVLPLYARFSGTEATDLFVGMAADASPEVRISALTTMVSLMGSGALTNVVAALDDEVEEVRLCAIKLLTRMEDSTPELVEAVSKRKGEVRRLSLIALANRGVVTPELSMLYVEFIYKGSECTDLSQREYLDSLAITARTLGASQSFDGLLALTSLARSVIRRLRRAAIEGIMHFDPDDRIDALYSLLDTYDRDVLKNVAMGLHEARDDRAVLPLIRAALECRGKPAMTAKAALTQYERINDIDFLIDCLSERWPSARRYGAERLRALEDPKCVPALLIASRDEDVEVQLAVFEAMGPFASNHDAVRERMLEGIAQGDISVRQAACEALGEARCKEAVPHLIKALHNFFLRPRATEAIKRIGDRKGYLALKRIERREALFPKKPRDAMLESRKAAATH